MTSGKTVDRVVLKRALDWLFDEEMFADWKRHGNMAWSFSALVTMALLWAVGGDRTLGERFRLGLEIVSRWYRPDEWAETYQGFLKILNRWTQPLQAALVGRLRQRMQELAGEHWRIAGWIVMAVDGTRVEAPRTSANEKWFARVPKHRRRVRKSRKSTRRRKSARQTKRQPAAPQVWLTVVWHLGMGLLWDWRQGPSGSSERAHLMEMLDDLPEKTLLVADAGFQGYDYWQTLLQQGHSFLIRVAGNVRLLRGLGYVRRYKNIVYLWPDRARKRRQPPVVLRLLEFHDGRRSVWLVTNVLDTDQLSQRQASELYRRRWGVEVFIRGFKQTFGRGKLRSHAPRNVEMELDWSLAAFWSLQLLAVRELLHRGQAPCQLSTAAALRAIRHCLQCAALGIDFDLLARLAAIRHDGYHRRQKSIRLWPRKKSQSPLRPPRIHAATTEQIQDAHELRSHAA